MKKIGPQIQEMLIFGLSNREIRKRTGASGATISYHAKKLGLNKQSKIKYDWAKIQSAIDSGHSLSDVKREFGMCAATLTEARKSGRIVYRQKFQMTAQELIDGIGGKISPSDRKLLRKKLIAEGVTYQCVLCGITEWNGKNISLELDHIDGDARNNTKTNLRLLCPNCHSQTPTWRGRNKTCY